MTDWKNIPPLFSRAALHPAVVARADAAPLDEPWCVAFSGGADSLALLLIVWAHWPQRRKNLVALHFNHALRGAESDGDEQFCREVCAALGVAIGSARWAEAPAQPSEAETREVRQAFFAREMAARGAVALWTGHQKDDIAETQLMRLARGAGPAGLAAPRPVNVLDDGRVYLRPLLTLGKTEIAAALTAAGVSWREDATNATRDYFRNRIRYDVLPRWQDAACNSVLGGAALSRELCEEDDEALEAWLAELRVSITPHEVDLRPLAGKPRALWRRVLRRWQPAASLSRAGFAELLAICAAGEGRVSLAEGFATVRDGGLCWQPPSTVPAWAPVSLGEGNTLFFSDGTELCARRVVLDEDGRQRVLGGRVDPNHEAVLVGDAGRLIVRRWQPGDRFRPLGAPGTAKLQDLFVNRGVPVAQRGNLPVVCSAAGEILWVPGFPPAEASKIVDTSVVALQLTYRSGTYTVPSQSHCP